MSGGNEKVLDRVRKLLALAQSDNVNEAATAAAAAERLMAEHKLEMADVEARTGQADDEDVVDFEISEDTTRFVGWRSNLVTVLAEVNGCDVIHWQKARWERPNALSFKVVGRASDTQAVSYLFKYLANEVDRLCTREGHGYGRSFANSFRHGAVATIAERLRAQKREREAALRAAADLGHKASEVALVVVDRDAAAVAAYKDKKFPDLRSFRLGGARLNDGYHAGREAGKTIALPGGSKGIGAAAKQLREVG